MAIDSDTDYVEGFEGVYTEYYSYLMDIQYDNGDITVTIETGRDGDSAIITDGVAILYINGDSKDMNDGVAFLDNRRTPQELSGTGSPGDNVEVIFTSDDWEMGMSISGTIPEPEFNEGDVNHEGFSVSTGVGEATATINISNDNYQDSSVTVVTMIGGSNGETAKTDNVLVRSGETVEYSSSIVFNVEPGVDENKNVCLVVDSISEL